VAVGSFSWGVGDSSRASAHNRQQHPNGRYLVEQMCVHIPAAEPHAEIADLIQAWLAGKGLIDRTFIALQ